GGAAGLFQRLRVDWRQQRRPEGRVVVDVGTNAEILLACGNRRYAASSPTGPAFEGAQIRCGQRAAPGAIERVRIDPATLEPRIRIIGSDLWSDEAGFTEAAAKLGVTGLCGSGIIEALGELFLAGVITSEGVIDGTLAALSNRVIPEDRTWSYLLWKGTIEIRITQADVRAIQLAKAALYAGVRLLMEHSGVDRLDRIKLAGAFGTHIDPLYALVIGMVPDCDVTKVTAVGNAAGTGARMALLNRAHRRVVAEIVRSVDKIETALEPRFQALFVDAMAFPNARDAFPCLSQTVRLPTRIHAPHDTPQRRGGRRGRTGTS
ncbi:MAG TPA: ATP-binding protein, partial [Beijerinckiaceae bacterium]|nr:ATP-binding protein [Beijerinckiaceae bacterium]